MYKRQAELFSLSDLNLSVPLSGDDVACLMFTSGSTGRPKGILSSHRNLVSTVTAQSYGCLLYTSRCV